MIWARRPPPSSPFRAPQATTKDRGDRTVEKTYYPLDERTARQAHEMMSFDEWKSEEPMYREAVDDAWDLAEAAARRDPGSADRAYGLADRYARKYAEWLNGKYRIGAMCPRP